MSYIVRDRAIHEVSNGYETILEAWVEYKKRVQSFLYINDHLCINRDRLEQEVGEEIIFCDKQIESIIALTTVVTKTLL